MYWTWLVVPVRNLTKFITVRGYSKSTAVVCVLSSGANAWGVRTWRWVPSETAPVIPNDSIEISWCLCYLGVQHARFVL